MTTADGIPRRLESGAAEPSKGGVAPRKNTGSATGERGLSGESTESVRRTTTLSLLLVVLFAAGKRKH